MKRIFLISGKAQHGKDLSARILKEKLGEENTLIVHFADYLKMIAEKYMGWDGQKDLKGRTLLQWLGTDRIRIELRKATYWADRVCEVIDILQDKYDYFIVPDTRFFNEIYSVKAMFPENTTTVRVERLNFENTLTEEQRKHLSEIQLDCFEFDYYIKSESGEDNLTNAVCDFLLWSEKEGKL